MSITAYGINLDQSRD